ncbi:short chain dehydrogenase domain-containing protein [Sarocladium implicatum]|nr:short chain dehydrogenase domain-containing protein [Sarocladium implicatum]
MEDLWKLARQAYPGQPRFTEKNVPDMSNKVIVVTGANTGIGKDVAEIMYSKNAKVYMLARSAEKTVAAMDSIKAAVPRSTGELVYLKLDLADLVSVKAAAQDFLARENKLHLLFSNAGVAYPDREATTVQNYPLQLGVNCIGSFALTKLLTPPLATAARASPPGTVRAVWTSSSGIYGTDVNAFQKNVENNKDQSIVSQYLISKMGNYLHSAEYAKKHREDGIVSVSLNPGNLDSDLWRTQGRFMTWFLRTFVLHPARYGAYTTVYAGTSPDISMEKTGSFVGPWGQLIEPTKKHAQAVVDMTEGGKGTSKWFWNWTEAEIAKHI